MNLCEAIKCPYLKSFPTQCGRYRSSSQCHLLEHSKAGDKTIERRVPVEVFVEIVTHPPALHFDFDQKVIDALKIKNDAFVAEEVEIANATRSERLKQLDKIKTEILLLNVRISEDPEVLRKNIYSILNELLATVERII
jgi:hypothetical protein